VHVGETFNKSAAFGVCELNKNALGGRALSRPTVCGSYRRSTPRPSTRYKGKGGRKGEEMGWDRAVVKVVMCSRGGGSASES